MSEIFFISPLNQQHVIIVIKKTTQKANNSFWLLQIINTVCYCVWFFLFVINQLASSSNYHIVLSFALIVYIFIYFIIDDEIKMILWH